MRSWGVEFRPVIGVICTYLSVSSDDNDVLAHVLGGLLSGCLMTKMKKKAYKLIQSQYTTMALFHPSKVYCLTVQTQFA